MTYEDPHMVIERMYRKGTKIYLHQGEFTVEEHLQKWVIIPAINYIYEDWGWQAWNVTEELKKDWLLQYRD